MLKKILLLGASAVALGAVAAPASADNIVTNQWYAGHFTRTPSPLFGGGFPGSDGPILPNFTRAGALPAPSSGSGLLTAVITLPHGGTLLVTDVETAGDVFEMFVNGNPAAQAPMGATGLIPGGQQSVGNMTSGPGTVESSCGEDIACALSDANYSSGTFYLPAGTDTITGEFIGSIGFGDMNLIVESGIPEPATLTVLGLGLAGLGFARRRRT